MTGTENDRSIASEWPLPRKLTEFESLVPLRNATLLTSFVATCRNARVKRPVRNLGSIVAPAGVNPLTWNNWFAQNAPSHPEPLGAATGNT